MESPDRSVLRFETTAKTSADAHALAHTGIARFDLVVDCAALVAALVLILTGYVPLGIVVAVVAALSLIGRRYHPLERALIARRYRGILGHATEVTVEDDGLRFTNPLGETFVRWSSIVDVRTDSQVVAFFRGSVLLGYVPTSAFASPAAQASFVDLVEDRIPARA